MATLGFTRPLFTVLSDDVIVLCSARAAAATRQVSPGQASAGNHQSWPGRRTSTATKARVRLVWVRSMPPCIAATWLFIQRGFEVVALGQVAEAADRATRAVLDDFGSTEELFFDGAAERQDELIRAVGERHPPVERVVASLCGSGHALLDRFSRPQPTLEQSPRTSTARVDDLARLRARLLAGDTPAAMRQQLHDQFDRGFDLLEHGLADLATPHPVVRHRARVRPACRRGGRPHQSRPGSPVHGCRATP